MRFWGEPCTFLGASIFSSLWKTVWKFTETAGLNCQHINNRVLINSVTICSSVLLWLGSSDNLFISSIFLRSTLDAYHNITKARSRRYPAETLTDADYADDIALLPYIPTVTKFLLYSQAAGGISLHVNAKKTDYVYFNNKKETSSL